MAWKPTTVGLAENLGPSALFCCLAASLLFYILYQQTLSPLARIPGPFLASVTPLWRVYHIMKGDWHDEIVRQHRKYGQFVRIAPKELSTTSPSAIRLAYSHSGQAWVKESWYQTWWARNNFHPTFAETDVQRHRNQRRRVSKWYSMSYIVKMQIFTDRVLDRFFQQMHASKGQPIDMAEWTGYFAFDVVGELGFGDWFGNLDASRDSDDLGHWVYLTLATHAALGWTWLGGNAAVFKPVRWLLNQSLFKRAGTHMDAFPLAEAIKRIMKKAASGTLAQRDDLVTQFRAMKNADGSDVHPQEISIEISNLVLAGADTTAITLRAAIYYISTHPRVYNKLRQEIDCAERAGKLSKVVTMQEAQGLPYFQVILKEALRLFPAVGYQLPRVAPKGGAMIDSYFIPEGAVLGTNAWSLHRNPKIYGEDCDEFRPERWLDKCDPDKFKTMEECFGSFGFGSRTCIGKNLAMMELSRLLPTLFRDFDVDICNPQKPWTITTGWFAFSRDFHVRVSPRQSVDGQTFEAPQITNNEVAQKHVGVE